MLNINLTISSPGGGVSQELCGAYRRRQARHPARGEVCVTCRSEFLARLRHHTRTERETGLNLNGTRRKEPILAIIYDGGGVCAHVIEF